MQTAGVAGKLEDLFFIPGILLCLSPPLTFVEAMEKNISLYLGAGARFFFSVLKRSQGTF